MVAPRHAVPRRLAEAVVCRGAHEPRLHGAVEDPVLEGASVGNSSVEA